MTVSLPTIERSLKTLNYSFKRVVFVPEARNSDVNVELRYEYSNEYLSLDENKILFLDEMGVNCSLRIGYGRSPVGSPAKKMVRSIRSKNYSICAGISKNGIVHYKTQNCAYNSNSFCNFLPNFLKK